MLLLRCFFGIDRFFFLQIIVRQYRFLFWFFMFVGRYICCILYQNSVIIVMAFTFQKLRHKYINSNLTIFAYQKQNEIHG